MTETRGGQFFVGVVEDRNDHLGAGRVRVRVAGLHYHDKMVLPTSDLPWAMVMQPATGGTGAAAIGPAEGTTVIVVFEDYPECQYPIVIGALAGIPQGNPVNVDHFEDIAMWKDDITPQGRPLPTNVAEATGNTSGGPYETSNTQGGVFGNQSSNSQASSLLRGGFTTGSNSSYSIPNPALSSILQSSSSNNPKTSKQMISTLIDPGADALGSTGGMLGSVNQVGASMNIAKSVFELMSKSNANSDDATQQFTKEASQNGPLGTALASIFNGRASLRAIAQLLGFNIASLQSLISNIGSSNQNNSDTQQPSTGNNSGGSSTNILDSLGGLFGSIGGLTGGSSGSGGLGGSSGSGGSSGGGLGSSGSSNLSDPEGVAEALLTLYASSAEPLEQDIGHISVMEHGEKLPGEVTWEDFKDEDEGSTPPVNGCFGGPNFGGTSPILEPPQSAISPKKTAKGSSGSVKTDPPDGYNKSSVKQNIQKLLDACKKYGLTTKEQQASLLGIVGGECGWIPQEEDCQYTSPDRIRSVFHSTFKDKPDLAEQYCNWKGGNKGEPKDFFDFVYDPANNGRQLGNRQPGDGGTYYGRGFIQLTGRSNYERYAALSGHKIDEEPDKLVSDTQVSAEVAVLYFMDRVRHAVPTAHPGYFYAALRAVGNNSAAMAKRKLQFYEHFYGMPAPETYGASDKIAGNYLVPSSYDGSAVGNGLGKDDGYGFKDPHGKYPLMRYHNEPQINRLARGVVKDTIVLNKQSRREMGVPIALDGGSWDQPQVPYGAKYPYNWVRETESGHIQEFDDTPGYERIHTYHRTGTFEEIDANGTVVRRIVGDKYEIIERNGFVSVHGACNLTVEGNVNIFCRSDANIEVAGSAEMKVGGNFDIGVARDMNVAVEGNFSLWANGAMNLQANGLGHIRTNDTLHLSSDKNINTYSEENTLMFSNMKLDIKTVEDIKLQTDANYHMTAATAAYNKTGEQFFVAAGGDIAMDGSNIHLNSDKSEDATEAEQAIKALVHGMVPPPLGAPINKSIERLAGPETHGEELYMYELPTDQQSQAFDKFSQNRDQQNGKSNTYESEKKSASGGGGSAKKPANQQEILNSGSFNGNYKLTKNFTLGMLFDGGFNAKHKLISQGGLSPQEIVSNLASLCENVLEKYLEELPNGINGYGKNWIITSGYRMAGVVAASSKTSDHNLGRAVDISLMGPGISERKRLHFELVQKLSKLVPYDQLLLEYSGPTTSWIHTSIRDQTFGPGGSSRKQAFTMVDHKKYGDGFILLS